ncbi:hypothetical protein N7535_004623 [Penicillium sp. DV-2018c]|nr:hypothetical protein N7535_004623 [Penicillium sp. DV-2018c]
MFTLRELQFSLFQLLNSSIWVQSSLPARNFYLPPWISPPIPKRLHINPILLPILPPVAQWVLSWHPAGKTSSESIFNIPGRIAWCAMEIVGPINLIYSLATPAAHSPTLSNLPTSNILVASLYCIHYLNRAIISPFFSAPSMSPIHPFIMTSAMLFNWFNSACLAGWLRGYTTDGEAGNNGNKFHKVYVIPPARGVFRYILYPHYVFEWLEWTGFALAGTAVAPFSSFSGFASSVSSVVIAPPLRLAPWLIPVAWAAGKLDVPLPLPAVVFVVNAVTNMLPHARWGRKWYVEKFGEKAVAGRGAAVPGCAWL